MIAFRAARRIVIKTGSALIAENGQPRRAWLSDFAADISRIKADGKDIILVSSGAVALGRAALGAPYQGRLDQKQAAAAIGQPRLMAALADAFTPHGLTVAQALLTPGDTETRRRWLNAKATLDTLLEAGIIPIINENDTVATEEIRYGDNDRLAARVAQMMSADMLILLSDVDGLYTEDPRKNPSAKHIAHLTALTPEHDAMASGANAAAGVGSGGMATKLLAARLAHAAGCSTIITLGDRQRPLSDIASGARATLIEAAISPASARAAWLAGNLKPEGAIHIDAGAANALRKGASLLAAGITRVDGQFDKGAAVSINAPDGTPVAKGVTAYSAADITRIMGRQSDDMESVLGYKGRPAIIHRDDLVRL